MLRRLIQTFEDRVDLPVEVDEIRDALIGFGIQDRIILSPEPLDAGTLKGAFYKWTEHNAVYGEPQWVTLVVYPANEPIEWQRLICAKELIHVCDLPGVRASDPEAVAALATKLLGPFEASKQDEMDIVAALDKLAQHLSINLLFPKAARQLARAKLADGEKTVEEIADWALVPLPSAQLALDEKWESLSTALIEIGNGDI
jgi:hypothetical protein